MRSGIELLYRYNDVWRLCWDPLLNIFELFNGLVADMYIS